MLSRVLVRPAYSNYLIDGVTNWLANRKASYINSTDNTDNTDSTARNSPFNRSNRLLTYFEQFWSAHFVVDRPHPAASLYALNAFLLALILVLPTVTLAAVSEASLSQSIVMIHAYKGNTVIRHASGVVVQSDRFNGYIVTNASVMDGAETYAIEVPGSSAQLVGQMLRSDTVADYALFKVNGLNLPPLKFAAAEPGSGEVVWSASKSDTGITLSKGLFRGGFKAPQQAVGVYRHTATTAQVSGSALLNECGQLIGLNYSATSSSDGSMRALDISSLARLLGEQNVKIQYADAVCISEVSIARDKAESASAEAKVAIEEAEQAKLVAKNLERQLQATKKSNDNLVGQTESARTRAESAIRAAQLAQSKADETSLELEKKTAEIRQETLVLVKSLEEDRRIAEQRFKEMLASQQEVAASRERMVLIIAAVIVMLVVALLVFFRMRSGGVKVGPRRSASDTDDSGRTRLHRQELSEYVLDGRDDDGIRYLLRISGDQLGGNDGVVIGRNPKDSPYIINHADVSRKHARIKVMKNRVFIEDLGSTNGTSVNGQSIDEKGLVSVSNGDQIIIGSVVMKLRVMDG